MAHGAPVSPWDACVAPSTVAEDIAGDVVSNGLSPGGAASRMSSVKLEELSHSSPSLMPPPECIVHNPSPEDLTHWNQGDEPGQAGPPTSNKDKLKVPRRQAQAVLLQTLSLNEKCPQCPVSSKPRSPGHDSPMPWTCSYKPTSNSLLPISWQGILPSTLLAS